MIFRGKETDRPEAQEGHIGRLGSWLQSPALCAFVALQALTSLGCETDQTIGPDAAEPKDIFGEVLPSGLGLAFFPKKPFPEEIGKDFDVILTHAEIVIVDLRLIGDATTSDNTKDVVEIDWENNPGIAVIFQDAPLGGYSWLRGTVIEFEVNGIATLQGAANTDFEIEAEGLAVPFEVELDFTLEAGTPLALQIEVDIGKLSEGLPFGSVVGGQLELTPGSEAVNVLSEKLAEAFELSGEFDLQ